MSNTNADNNRTKKKSWSSESVDGALLFILFIERIFHPNSYSASEIFHHRLLPFEKSYSSKSFASYCTTLSNKCIKYERTGTGLTKKLKESIKKARVQYADILRLLKEGNATGYTSLEEDEEDPDYEEGDHKEEDIELSGAEEEDNVSLSDRFRNSPFEQNMPSATASAKSSKPGQSSKAATSKGIASPTTETSSRLLSLRDPYLVTYPDFSKLFCQMPITGNTDEDEDFNIVLLPRKVQGWSRIPKELESAFDMLGEDARLSDNPNNCINCCMFQAAINERLKNMQTKEDEQGRRWVMDYELETPFEIEIQYYDCDDEKADDFLVQSNGKGYHYAQFWLKPLPKKKIQRTKGRRVGKAKKE